MTPQDVEASLSYAYLYAIASHAGVACQEANRAHDNLGIDACLSLRRDFGELAVFTELSVHVQLEATVKPSIGRDGRMPYFLANTVEYDRLRKPSALPPRLLGVLFLPPERTAWLSHDVEQLILRRCAYWVSLVGAPECDNLTGQTVYLPSSQALSPTGLIELFRRLACQEELRYGT